MAAISVLPMLLGLLAGLGLIGLAGLLLGVLLRSGLAAVVPGGLFLLLMGFGVLAFFTIGFRGAALPDAVAPSLVAPQMEQQREPGGTGAGV